MKKLSLLFTLLILILSCNQEPELIKLSGPIFGTAFNIQYYADGSTNYTKDFEQLFAEVNQSLSTYQNDSDISKLNNGESIKIDHHFKAVFNASKKIYRETEGAFDPTIGNVVNAWNFGAEENKFLTDSTTIAKLMRYVGFNRVGIVDDEVKKSKNSYLEFNAIAKGYGIDVIADFLESKGVTNYLVEIGGDLRASGLHLDKNKTWSIGINDPNFDGSESYSKVIAVTKTGMATSGTYRKFKTDENGKRYAHIINTKTGYPSKSNVLSVSVIAPNAMLADGYATAFQAMGIQKVEDFLSKHPELKVYFIYLNAKNEMETLSLNDFPK